jgi:hypothetical protein
LEGKEGMKSRVQEGWVNEIALGGKASGELGLSVEELGRFVELNETAEGGAEAIASGEEGVINAREVHGLSVRGRPEKERGGLGVCRGGRGRAEDA